ncbi:cell division protein FtsZ [Candidatus Kaiserbacteria bacterium]|nr:cell division protein FtsZ [Candidatus Kaiserbacteria bacterium]
MKKIQPDVEAFARIRVIGVGGSGNNAVNHMVDSKVRGVDFVAVNTDAQDLHHSLAKKKIHIGKNLTRGLGTGMNPEMGKRAAEETKEEIQEALKGSDMIFVTYGLGGGTGTGAGPVVAKTARESGALTVAVVTKPFSFEGQQRMRLAELGLEELKKEVDALVVIPNDRLLAVVQRETSVKNAFAMCDNILKEAVEGISDLITMPGIINVDFADIRAVMDSAGSALMGIGTATGEKRTEDAAKAAISSPLLEISIAGAKGVLFSVAGGDDLSMLEIQDAAKVITESIDPNAKVIFGAVLDPKLKKNEVKVTVIATGFPENALHPGGKSTSLFQLPKKDQERDEEKKDNKIYNSVGILGGIGSDDTKKVDKKDEPKKEDELKKEGNENDDDDWGAVPAFLRRSKLK